MAARLRKLHSDEVRAKIQASQIINRLHDNMLGKIEMTQGQLKSAEILLRKSLPDLSSVELKGEDGNAIPVNLSIAFK